MDTQSLATILGAQLEAIDRSQGRIEFTPDGVIIDVNKNYLEAMGYHRDEVLGRHHRCFVEPTYRESQAYARFWEKLRSGEHHCDEFVRIAKDGSRRWIQANYNPILDEAGRVWKVVKYAVDITRQKQAEQIAERAAVALDAQLAAIDRSQGRIEFNPDGVIIDVNDNYLRMMGYSRHEVIGRQHRMFVPGEILDDEGYLAFWASLRKGDFHSGDFERLARGGSHRWIQATYNPVVGMSGEVEKVVKYAIDITAQRELLATLAQRQRLEALGSLAAGVAHEINTPLQTAMSCLDFLCNALDAKAGDHVGCESPHRDEARQSGEVSDSSAPHGALTILGPADAIRGPVEVDRDDLANAGSDAREAIDSISRIVLAMNSVTDSSTERRQEVFLKDLLAGALTLTRSKWKGLVEPSIEIAVDTESIYTHRASLFRIVSQMICAAVESIEAARLGSKEKSVLEVFTRSRGQGVLEIVVADNGLNATRRPRGSSTYRLAAAPARLTGQDASLPTLDELALADLGAEWTLTERPSGGATAILAIPTECGDGDGPRHGQLNETRLPQVQSATTSQADAGLAGVACTS